MSLYKIDSTTVNPSNVKTYVRGGIQDNLKLVNAEYKVVEKTGTQLLALTWEDLHGNPLSYTLFQPKPFKPIEAMSLEEKAKFIDYKIGWPMGILRQILEVYKGEIDYSKTPIAGESFKELVENFLTILGDSYKGKLMRIKVVYDDKGYSTIPKNPKYTFIESMDVLKEKSSIQKLEGDVFERPERKGDEERVETNPLNELKIPEIFAIEDKNSDEIPF